MNLLIVDDDRVTRELLKEIFELEDFHVTLASGGEEALEIFQTAPFPIVLSDIRMLETDGMALLAAIKETQPDTIVILMTGFGTMEGAITALQRGAFDYISKPFRIDELKSILSRARRHWESQHAPGPNQAANRMSFSISDRALLGRSPKIVDVYKTLARATMSPSHVLIVGENGTGKQLVARGIHDHSPRREKPFLVLDCATLSETLFESELFGHVVGAFQGAHADKVGALEIASGGTLFLEEVGKMPIAIQAKLLRVLQEGESRRLGANDSRRCDVRVIAASQTSLDSAVATGEFRDDFYYRLKVIQIELPALRERLEDLPELIHYFLARFSAKMEKPVSHVSDEAMDLLRGYTWPGNVRELEHAIERAVTMTRTSVLYPEDFPGEIRNPEPMEVASAAPRALEDVERAHILRVLEETGHNKSKAATLLGIDRKTLHRKAQKYRIGLDEKL